MPHSSIFPSSSKLQSIATNQQGIQHGRDVCVLQYEKGVVHLLFGLLQQEAVFCFPENAPVHRVEYNRPFNSRRVGMSVDTSGKVLSTIDNLANGGIECEGGIEVGIPVDCNQLGCTYNVGGPSTREISPVQSVNKNLPHKRRCKNATAMELGESNNINESEDAVRGGEPSMGSYLRVEDTCNLGISDSVSGCSQQGQHFRKQRRRKGLCAALEYDLVPSSPSVLDSPTFCVECGAKKFQYETPGFCCSGGSVKLATNDYPQELVKLFDVGDQDTLHFRTYARLYNNLFAFSSLGGKIECSKKKGVFVFSLHGQLYHYIPPLSPEDQRPQYLQLYFYDALHERENRTNLFDVLRPDVVSIIMRVMEKNPYANFFKSLRDKVIDEHTTILINKSSSLDQRTFNAPTADEVAVIWPEGSSCFENCGPYIVVTGGNNETHRIMHHYGCYDPLQYPLLFPYGDSGWHQGIKKKSAGDSLPLVGRAPVRAAADAASLLFHEELLSETSNNNRAKYVSCREYYSFKLQIRDGNYLLRAGRLLLQFIVDMYVKLENTRLDFLRNNQATIRADLYQGILDTLESGEANGANVGRRVVLPPSFIGGPRDMRKRYLNAMRLVQKYGKPDLFITMTCNPNWKEIKDELRPGEQAQDRPDLIVRIFRAKLIRAKKLFMEERVMGNVAAMIYVVEFQKRGLPHAHFLLILAKEHKIKSVDEYDKYVSAEIPPLSQPYLRKVVVRHMMHGPCGITHQSCPCMEEKNGRKVCRSGFPKKFAAHTTSHDDGYPIYRRRQIGETVRVRGEDLDNQWVIPYNPYLLALFDCHLNVEVCSTIQAVKYLYKYVYKGHDRISFDIVGSSQNQGVDEIEKFQSGRWVSPPEAAWRIFGFDLYEMHPSVLPLQIHLPNMQSVVFEQHENLEAVVSEERRCRTPLTEFFKVNASRGADCRYLYVDFPEYFVWDNKARQWTERKRHRTLGRLTFVSPSEGERYYLRVLLSEVYSPTSFDDLLIVNNHRCSSFQEAAVKRGFIEENNALEKCLDEAMEFEMPHTLRRLFVTSLIFEQPPNPIQLWEKYYTSLSEDFRHHYPTQPDQVMRLTVLAMERLLEGNGKTLDDFSLEYLKLNETDEMRLSKDIQDVVDAPIPDECINARKLLNPRQKEAYKAVIEHIKNDKAGVFFIDGPGGTGKTFLYCALYAKVRQMGKIVLLTATSGIAAANIPTGRTAHSRFKLPIDLESSLICNVPKQGSLAALLKKTDLIIWDEASMANKLSIHSLDLLLRDLCKGTLPFGGKIIVFGGDFRQVLPVVPKKSQKEAVLASLVCSPLWPEFKRFHLTENMRAREDPAYASFLLSSGNGSLQKNESASIPLPIEIILENGDNRNSLQALSEFVFPTLGSGSIDVTHLNDRAILTPKNADVDYVNSLFITEFIGDTIKYKSFDSVLDEHCNIYPTEFLHTLCPGGMSLHELVLKKDCPVILLRNIDPSSGLCNGTRLVCRRFYRNSVLCEVLAGCHKGEQVLLPRISFRPSETANFPFKFERKQFPIKLCFAMTINKSQGQTLSQVGIYLREPCFSHGQLYVALSRAKRASNIRVLCEKYNDTVSSGCTTNVVSFDILRRAGIIEEP